MSPELEKKLTKRYRFMFRGVNLPLTQNLMPFGFECGDGWFNIIDTLCRCIQFLRRDHRGARWSREFIVIQVKEKYGGLRFYTSGIPDVVYELILFAEHLSVKTCEECGAPGYQINTGWVYTRCSRHAEQLLNNLSC